MPRRPRIETPGGFFHVTTRGCNRGPIFAGDDTREYHLALLAETVDKYLWILHAYTQMDNHFHLVVQTPEPTLSAGMQYLNGTYAQAYNRHVGRSGHLFQGRFHSVAIEWDGQLRETERYTVLNRLRARACSDPADWRWSSYAATAGLERKLDFLTIDLILAPFGPPDATATRERYRAFVAEGARDTSLHGVLTRTAGVGRRFAD